MDDPKAEGETIVSLDLDHGSEFVILRAAWMQDGVVRTASKSVKTFVFQKSKVPGLFRRMLLKPLLEEPMPEYVIDRVVAFFDLLEKHSNG